MVGIAGAVAGAAVGVGVATGGDDPSPPPPPPTPPPAASAPSAPSSPGLTAGDGQLGVSWTAPSANGAAIDDYDVRYRPAGGSWTELPDGVKSAATSATVTGLTNRTAYEVQVRAGNSAGDGPWSASATGTPEASASAPSAPSSPGLTAGDGQLGVSWTPPADNGAAIDDYDVRYRPVGGGWTELPDTVNSTVTSATITGLTNGTTYEVQVRAGNSAGDGPWSASATGTPMAVGDRAVLIEFYNATDGPNWTNNRNWNSDAPLGDWHGVSTAGGRVTRLLLHENRLTGSIPSSLGSLASLEGLHLYDNELTGSIPPSLGSLVSLEGLHLYDNELTGSIPSSLGSLANLTTWYLSGNELTGSIPSSLGSLVSLVSFTLHDNQLTGSIPAALCKFADGINPQQGGVNLPGCGGDSEQDRAVLVEFYNATNGQNWTVNTNWNSSAPLDQWHGVSTDSNGRVRDLQLRENKLSGAVPSSLGSLTNLEVLDLIGNSLTGSLSSSLGSLTNLEWLSLVDNQLTGSIPPSLGSLTNLTGLRLSNNQLTGSIPPSLSSLTNLTGLHLSNNELTGSIPSSLGSLTNLTCFNLGSNELTGSIPSSLGSLTNLTCFNLGSNELTGSIPSSSAASRIWTSCFSTTIS